VPTEIVGLSALLEGNKINNMKEIIIAFDVDGTILNNEGIPPGTPPYARPKTSVNLEIVLLIQILSKKMKNTKIIVWSGGGKEYAESIVRQYGLDKYVHSCHSKSDYDESVDGKVDICFDDIHDCILAEKNIIVKMK
jgi:phosphoserine phosphatase